MRALLVHEPGEAECLQLGEIPAPRARPGHVVVRVEASGVNPVDASNRADPTWAAIEPPYVVGYELAGVVDSLGEGVSAVAVGDRVWGLLPVRGTRWGAYAELVELRGDWVSRRPAALAAVEAAAIPLAGSTAVQLLDRLGLSEGDSLLVHGAAGGVGSAAVQLARARGARVIGTASEANHDFLRSLGAEPTTYGDGMVDRIRALAPDGVDLAFDTAGKGGIPDLITLTGDPARVATIADFGAAALGAKVTGGSAGRAPGALDEAARLVEAGRLHVPVQPTFTFAEAPEAHRLSESGHVRGKLVLVPG
jgi:NADPH:quinone reductase-like Zn-dependent oxidoreductase